MMEVDDEAVWEAVDILLSKQDDKKNAIFKLEMTYDDLKKMADEVKQYYGMVEKNPKDKTGADAEEPDRLKGASRENNKDGF